MAVNATPTISEKAGPHRFKGEVPEMFYRSKVQIKIVDVPHGDPRIWRKGDRVDSADLPERDISAFLVRGGLRAITEMEAQTDLVAAQKAYDELVALKAVNYHVAHEQMDDAVKELKSAKAVKQQIAL
jgi:hypothetical protein